MKSRIAGRVVAVAAAVAASCCFITPAFAGNVGKTSWSAYLTGWNTADTPNRQKQDASNGYIKADHVSGDRTIRAWMLGYANRRCGIRRCNSYFRPRGLGHQPSI